MKNTSAFYIHFSIADDLTLCTTLTKRVTTYGLINVESDTNKSLQFG